MKMSPEEANLTFRSLTSGVLRALMGTALSSINRQHLGADMSLAVASTSIALHNLTRAVEEPYERGKIPVPAEVRAKMIPVLTKVIEDLQALCDDIFTVSETGT